MPYLVSPVADEREALTRFLAHQQEAFRVVLHGLTDGQARRAPSASAFSLAHLLKHVTVVQDNWLTGVEAAPEPLDDETSAAIAGRDDSLRDDDTLASLLEEYDAVCARVLAAVAERDPDTAFPVPRAPWFPDLEAWSLRWVWHHLVTELARHAGHADIIRETLDGGTMFELIAAHEDIPEQPPYLRQWKPREAPFTTGLSTVALFAADPAAARAWYTELLGAEPYFDNGPYVEWRLGPHDHELGLLDAAYAPDHHADGRASGITYWEVPDAAKAHARLLELGATEQWAPRDFGGGYVGASVVDPFGNVLGVMQRALPASSA